MSTNEQMTYDDLKKKHELLLEKVRRMRALQIDYFKYRASSDLDRAKRLEREVDYLVKVEVKEQRSQQNKMF